MGRFLITDSLLVVGLLLFPVFLESVSIACVFLGICPFHVSNPIFGKQCSYFSFILILPHFFNKVSSSVPSLIPDSNNLDHLFFLGQSSSGFVDISKNNFWFH